MAKRKGSSVPSCSRARKKVDRDAREAENAKRLENLPPEMWEKILDELEDDDLFPLDLSCRCFREKQKELLARPRQRELHWFESPRRALATDISLWPQKCRRASAEYLRFIRKEKVPRDVGRQKAKYVRRLAAYHGHLPLLQELLADLKTLNGGIAQSAARGGQLETLQWLKTQKGFKLNAELFAEACNSGNLEMIKRLRSEGCPWDEEACREAAESGHLETLKWLRSNGCPWNEIAYFSPARDGRFEVLQWLRSEGCPLGSGGAWVAAAMGGDLEVMKWLQGEGCPLSVHACWGAAAGGHLEALKWLRSEGCPWDERTCRRAASGDHLDVLKYAREHGCPWDVWTWYRAGEATREWLMEIDCPWTHLDPDDHDPELFDDSDSEDADIKHAASYRS